MPLDQIDVDQIEEHLPQTSTDHKPAGEMSFVEHLEELRWHIIRGVIAVFVFGIAAFLAKDFVFNTILFGPRNKSFWTYQALCNLSQATCITPPEFKIITRDLSETFMTHMSISFWLGVILAVPYLLWEVWRFVKPGLHEKERKAANGFVWICSGLFLTGVLFGYFVVAPLAISFLANYKVEGVDSTPTLGSYIDSMIMFTFPIGLVFELPVLVYFLARIGLITPEFMRSYRRYAVVILLTVAAIITPSPDVASQMLVFIPLYGLYELSILVAVRVVKKLELEEKEFDKELKIKN